MEITTNLQIVEPPLLGDTYPHQLEAYKLSRDKKFFALFMEQGTGKTKVIIDTADYLFANGFIDAVLVLCPNGLQQNWHFNEIPKFCSVEHENNYYSAGHIDDDIQAVVNAPTPGKLKWLSCNIDMLLSDWKYLQLINFCKRFRTLLVIDESTLIKTPTARRTKRAMELGQFAQYRRILTGTPSPQGPTDLFSQMKFLSKSLLPMFQTFTSFKAYFCVMKQIPLGARSFWKIVGFRNEKQLGEMIAPHCYRVLKKDCLKLPEKVHKQFYVQLSPKEVEAYKTMKHELMVQLEHSLVTVASATAAMIKLQQILSGYIFDNNTQHMNTFSSWRAEQVIRFFFATETPIFLDYQGRAGKFIIFFRFKEEIKKFKHCMITGAYKRKGDSLPFHQTVEYTGDMTAEQRIQAVKDFQEREDIRVMLATSAAARGLTLTQATHIIYFSQDFNLETRLQSEDRAHRIGQDSNVTYWNVVAPKTIDERIQAVLSGKMRVSENIAQSWKQFFVDEPVGEQVQSEPEEGINDD